jgi:hypothetical protein
VTGMLGFGGLGAVVISATDVCLIRCRQCAPAAATANTPITEIMSERRSIMGQA